MRRSYSMPLAVIGAAIMGLASPAFAQTAGPNGGLMQTKGDHGTELVVKPDQIAVYLYDDGKPLTSKGAKVRAVVQQGGKNQTINLADSGGKMLVGELEIPLSPGAIVVITGKNDHDHAGYRALRDQVISDGDVAVVYPATSLPLASACVLVLG